LSELERARSETKRGALARNPRFVSVASGVLAQTPRKSGSSAQATAGFLQIAVTAQRLVGDDLVATPSIATWSPSNTNRSPIRRR
jgi:hypothetical protein